MTDRARAIAVIEEARQSHVDWRDHLREGCDGSCWTPQALVETAEKQQEWVDKYDLVLRVLREAEA